MYGKEARAQKSPIYGPSELSLFAEETILNTGHNHNMHETSRAKKKCSTMPFIIGIRDIESSVFSLSLYQMFPYVLSAGKPAG